jgi:hypothetical protein
MENLIDQINAEIKADENQASQEIVAPKRRGRKPKVANEIFVEIWNAALTEGSIQDVANRLGCSPASVSVKASQMRKKGYDLQQFKRGRRRKIVETTVAQ